MNIQETEFFVVANVNAIPDGSYEGVWSGSAVQFGEMAPSVESGEGAKYKVDAPYGVKGFAAVDVWVRKSVIRVERAERMPDLPFLV